MASDAFLNSIETNFKKAAQYIQKIYILFILEIKKKIKRYINLIGQKCSQILKLLFKILH